MNTSNSKSLLIVVFLLTIVISCSDLYAQQIYKINDKIGGSPGTTDVQSSDDGMLYIIGGVVIAAILIYALTRDKPEIKDDTDSTKAEVSNLYHNNSTGIVLPNNPDSYRLPVDFYFGIKKIDYFNDENKYELGVRFSL